MRSDDTKRSALLVCVLMLSLLGSATRGHTPRLLAASMHDAALTPTLATCPITPFAPEEPGYEFTPTWYGHGGLWAGLDRGYAGRWYASVGADDLMKVMWWRDRGVYGSLMIEGHRLDVAASPLDAWIPDYGKSGYQLGALAFPTEGCWEVVGRVDQTELRFVVFVHPGPAPRGEPEPAGEDVWASLRRPLLNDPHPATSGDCAPVHPEALPVYPAGAALDGGLHGVNAKGWWAIAPTYRGPVLIRGHQLDGKSVLQFTATGSPTSELRLDGKGFRDSAVTNPDGSDDPDWRYFALATLVPATGCYAVQVDGWNFSQVLIMPANR